MKLEQSHVNKSALSALLFICVYHVVSLFIHGVFIAGFMFLCAAVFCGRILINEQKHNEKPQHTHYASAIGCTWLAIIVLLFTVNTPTPAIGIWFCITMLGTSILLRPTYSFSFNAIALSIFWMFAFMELAYSFIYFESALALSIILILSSIIQGHLVDLKADLNTAKETDNLTGSIQPTAFKAELEKVVQLYDRYETPFSLICIKYQNNFTTEADLQLWLKELSSLYQSRLRKTDIFCRFNTQKFMILLPSTNTQNADALLEDLKTCATAYEFSFKNESSSFIKPPTLSFSAESFVKDETIEEWFRKIQSQ